MSKGKGDHISKKAPKTGERIQLIPSLSTKKMINCKRREGGWSKDREKSGWGGETHLCPLGKGNCLHYVLLMGERKRTARFLKGL